MHACNFLFAYHSLLFTKVLTTYNVGGVVVDHLLFRFFRYVDLFWSYSRSKEKVVKHRAEYSTFFALPTFVGAPLPKIVHTLSRMPHATSPGKVS